MSPSRPDHICQGATNLVTCLWKSVSCLWVTCTAPPDVSFGKPFNEFSSQRQKVYARGEREKGRVTFSKMSRWLHSGELSRVPAVHVKECAGGGGGEERHLWRLVLPLSNLQRFA